MDGTTIRDRATLGAISGVLAILVRDAYTIFAKAIGFSKVYAWTIAADIFVRGKEVHSFQGVILGILADTALGAILGVSFIYLLKLIGYKNIVIKGWGFGFGLWLLLFGILLHSLPESAPSAPKDALSNLSAFVSHSLFGLTLGYLVKRLLDRYNLAQIP